MRVSKEGLENFINESVVQLGRVRARKELQAFEAAIRPFIQFWDNDLETLMRARLSLSDEDAVMLAHYVKEFRTAGSNLSTFLRGQRLKMMKGSK